MNAINKEIDFLAQFITDNKKERIEEVLKFRTRHFTVVLEDIYQAQNASAVLRTSDAFGLQDVHIIENKHEYQVNPLVTQGADKWLNSLRYNERPNNTKICMEALKSKGYKIVATTLEHCDYELQDVPVEDKLALVFGTEKIGISKDILDAADIRMRIPMYGFSQSFNISVSAAITFSSLITKLHQSDVDWHLSDTEKKMLKLAWYKKITDFENKVLRS